MNSKFRYRSRSLGVSLIELMIALAIASVLVLGLIEVFSASRVAYKMSEGIARVQENGRFAVDYLQRDLRMAGHMGCVNDQARFQTAPSGFGTLFATAANRAAENYAAVPFQLRFDTAITGYEANGTAPGNTVNLAAPPAGWTPALPAALTTLGPSGTGPLPGTDVVVLRYFSPEGAPMTNLTPGVPATVRVDPLRWPVLTSGGVANPGLFGIADCLKATVFQAKTAAAGVITIDGTGLNLSDFSTDRYLQGQTTVHRAETVVYYIANNTAAPARPSLFRTRFTSLPGAGALTANNEELVEGIENMQLLYGQDRQTDPTIAPSGYMNSIHPANALTAVGTVEQTWRRIGVVKVGLLAVSPDPVSSVRSEIPPQALGVRYTVPANDGRLRAVYESTIALRNRLYGN